jgi:hypothetical protein
MGKMRNMILVALLGVVMVAGGADAAVVRCMGTACGGTGLPPGILPQPFLPGITWDYLYEVTVNVGDHLNAFQVGTCDGNIANYGGAMIASLNWVTMLAGGPGQLVAPLPQFQEPHHTPPFTPHGGIVGAIPPPGIPGQGSGPDGMCPYVVRWMCPQTQMGSSATFYFGFNNPNMPHDVGGLVGDITLSQIVWDEDWQKAVGTGLGPLHGPIPEPMTLLLLAAGACLVRRRR